MNIEKKTLAILVAGIMAYGVTGCQKEEVQEKPEGGTSADGENNGNQTGGENDEIIIPDNATAYVTKVFDYRPAPGQFVNTLPEYVDGDTQEDMNRKVLEAIGGDKKGMITLGGYGGYVVVGFDHTIVNRKDAADFKVMGNAFKGSSEPGIIMVAYDRNKDGLPNDDEWYEIAGSAHTGTEEWYEDAKKSGNIMDLYKEYSITYKKPAAEPANEDEMKEYIEWSDNKGHSGFKVKNIYHSQPYYPQWIDGDKLTFSGTCLPQNGVNNGTESAPYFLLSSFSYGYADNVPDNDEKSNIDIDWAVDSEGNPANLPGVDFIKIYTGVNQENGWLGECSTEVMGVVDLSLLKK